ncbi:MAG: 4-alpha-glucanotransferase [Bacteroidales bacterium]|nr:4-alpha-glucanotransferase [Bacteroidales bacterium]
MNFKRSSGILLHPSSLPGKYGIGSFGKECLQFIDFLTESHQTYWQILPLGPTGYGDSPYQCFSSMAGNPYLIDLEKLVEEGYLQPGDLHHAPEFPADSTDYNLVQQFKNQMLSLAFTRFRNMEDERKGAYNQFVEENASWLADYALFMAIKQQYQLRCWIEWDEPYRNRQPDALQAFSRQHADDIQFQQFIQYVFFSQWLEIRNYANSKGIQLIGDIPIYIAFDSVESWTRPEIFLFDEQKLPIMVAGVPPDYFSETGQLWGNPVYNWDYLKQTDFQWWKDRIQGNLKLYDLIRIDHFRGFAAYWAVPYGEPTAINGTWNACPGTELFDSLLRAFGELPIIAEDLGVITDEVVALRERYGFPGMKILQFAFDSDEKNNYLPHTYDRNFIVYTGTHDNNTVRGWYEDTHDGNRFNIENYLGGYPAEGISAALIRMAHASVANVSIVPLQDILGLDAQSRMNTPGTTSGNWQWRYRQEVLTPELARWFGQLTKTYDR